ncbi:cyclic nucleotide-binding protein [Solidesulfovibrio fructosivorans JJ]]|uniref:Cyclic nucleotide-binding protein n=1 Tax=Solidesulfovibrio fructosivorans JJ] TaxID=596151 RepID=E1JX79_SOLFR|nr:ATPase, T2SS/T4P/T4SS family [Solidesulfovibrio fructosivorans]EFL51044.1 cyclic nucleotide-binding protein [Solidesulfovibrio fructosivorans JJ]]
MEKFTRLVSTCVKNGITDLHIRADRPVAVRRNGHLHFQRDIVFDAAELEALLRALATDRQRRTLTERWSLDFSSYLHDAQMRLNAFYSADGLGLAVRFLPAVIPDFEALNLHSSLRDLCSLPHGLILICGPTGNGKSTTIAAMIREINETRSCHIITLEDPIEYRFASGKALVDQRELGAHFLSFEQGLQDVLREDGDVIMVGELRDPETMRLTVNAAEAGHVVIATLHAGTPEEALLRLCNAYGEGSQEYARAQIASCLAAVVVQRMEVLARVGFRAPVLSVVRTSSSVKNVIRENRFNQLEGIQQAGRNEGMFTFERYREEFLDQKARLTPPTLAFRPSPDTPIPSRPMEAPQPAPTAPCPEPAQAAAHAGPETPVAQTRRPPRQAESGQGGPYRIDDDLPLEELVAQMRKSMS